MGKIFTNLEKYKEISSELQYTVHNYKACCNSKEKKSEKPPSRVIYSHCGIHWGPTYGEFLGRSPNITEKKQQYDLR